MATDERDVLLIVDDDAINRAILEQIFAEDYAVLEAENGRAGLEKILEAPERLCAVLLDVVMPEMDSMEVLRHLSREGLLDRLPVFLITAEASGQVLREAYSLGVMDVIGKPVVPYVVRRRVRSVIELYQARRRLSRTVESQRERLLRQAEEIIELNQGMVEALAAILHDVGKIAVPDAILNKPGRLTAEEFEIMKTHTTQGAAMLEQIPQLQKHRSYRYAVDIARHHHERWDGRGYPDGLKGDEISLWAQVVSLADVYDALSCKRVYKNAFPRERVLEMIRDGECGVFNPELLRCFFEIEEELSRMYRKEETE